MRSRSLKRAMVASSHSARQARSTGQLSTGEPADRAGLNAV